MVAKPVGEAATLRRVGPAVETVTEAAKLKRN